MQLSTIHLQVQFLLTYILYSSTSFFMLLYTFYLTTLQREILGCNANLECGVRFVCWKHLTLQTRENRVWQNISVQSSNTVSGNNETLVVSELWLLLVVTRGRWNQVLVQKVCSGCNDSAGCGAVDTKIIYCRCNTTTYTTLVI